MNPLNKRLRQMRKHLGLSQAEFGASGGVSQSTQNRFEQTSADIPLSYLEKIYKTYKHSIRKSWLYFGEGEMVKTWERSFSDNSSGAGSQLRNEIASQFTADLTEKESQIVAEVGKFSEFLRNRPLPPQLKRRLLELLIESIDQVFEALHQEEK